MVIRTLIRVVMTVVIRALTKVFVSMGMTLRFSYTQEGAEEK